MFIRSSERRYSFSKIETYLLPSEFIKPLTTNARANRSQDQGCLESIDNSAVY